MNWKNFKLFNLTTFSVVLALLAFIPAQVLAHEGVDGNSSTSSKSIISTTSVVLTSVQVSLGSTTTTHACVVTASATVLRDGSSSGTGYGTFGINMDTTSSTLTSGSTRRLQFIEAALSINSVTTTYVFKGLTGSHTFYFLGKLSQSPSAKLTVNSASITAVCSETVL